MRKQAKTVEREYLSVDDAETITGVSRWTWRRWAYDGKIASVKVGKCLRIPMTELRRVMTEGLRTRPIEPEA